MWACFLVYLDRKALEEIRRAVLPGSMCCWYGLGRAWIEGLRTDSLYFFGLELFGAPIRTSQVLAVVSAAVAAGAILIYELKFRSARPG